MQTQRPLSPDALLGTFGAPFVRYLLALEAEDDVLSALVAAEPAVAQLAAVMYGAPVGANAADWVALAGSSAFARYDPSFGTSIANAMRQASGGDLEPVPPGEDPVVQAVREVARDAWPVLLLPTRRMGPGTMPTSLATGTFLHPSTVVACKAIMSDPHLSSLFPDSPSIEQETELTETIMNVAAMWMLNTGHGGSQQLSLTVDLMIHHAAVLCRMRNGILTAADLMEAVPDAVGHFRALATMKPVNVPALVGFEGVILDAGDQIIFGADKLAANDGPEALELLAEPERVTSILATEFPVELLKVAGIRDGDDGAAFLDGMSDRSMELEVAQRQFQQRIDRVRLAVLLSSGLDDSAVMGEISRAIADPTQMGGQRSWRLEKRVLGATQLDHTQQVESVRFHQLITAIHPPSLDIAMRRILSATSARWDPTDAFIDAVVVWENAFGTNSETTFRVTGAIAKLLEAGEVSERAILQKELKRLYEIRSRLVHGAKEPSPAEAWAYRDRAVEIALGVLRALYDQRPDLLPLTSDARSAQLLLEGSAVGKDPATQLTELERMEPEPTAT